MYDCDVMIINRCLFVPSLSDDLRSVYSEDRAELV